MAAAVAMAALYAVACTVPPASDRTVVVFAAASTIDALEAAAADFTADTGIEVRTSFGPSSTLARQVAEGAPAEIFLSASSPWADHVEERVAVSRRAALAGNRLVIVASASGGGGDATVAEALAAGRVLRLAIADPQSVPAGIYAREALERLGLWQKVSDRLIPTVDVRAALTLAIVREADAAVVYASDAASSNEVRIVAAFDPVLHPPIEYPLLLLGGAGAPAQQLFEFLVSERGRSQFLARGFTAPPR
jgi:molybdate transport system substrate-binding protein